MTNASGKTVVAVKSILEDKLWWFEVTTNPTSALLNDTPCITTDVGAETLGLKHNLAAIAFASDESIDPGMYKQTVT